MTTQATTDAASTRACIEAVWRLSKLIGFVPSDVPTPEVQTFQELDAVLQADYCPPTWWTINDPMLKASHQEFADIALPASKHTTVEIRVEIANVRNHSVLSSYGRTTLGSVTLVGLVGDDEIIRIKLHFNPLLRYFDPSSIDLRPRIDPRRPRPRAVLNLMRQIMLALPTDSRHTPIDHMNNDHQREAFLLFLAAGNWIQQRKKVKKKVGKTSMS